MFHVQYLCRGENPKFDEKEYVLFLVNALFSMMSWGTCKNKKQDSFYKVYIDQAWEIGKHISVVGHKAMLLWCCHSLKAFVWRNTTAGTNRSGRGKK